MIRVSHSTFAVRLSVSALSFAAAAAMSGCVESPPPESNTSERAPKVVEVEFDRNMVLETSILSFEMRGTERIVPKTARVELSGEGGSYPEFEQFFAGEIERDSDVGPVTVRLPVDRAMWSELDPADGDRFQGKITVELYDELGMVATGTVSSVEWTFRRDLTPSVDALEVGETYVNESVTVEGSGFLRPDEGETVALVRKGERRRPDGSTEALAGERLSLRWSGDRTRARLPIDPAVFGVEEGGFDVTLTFENQLRNGVRHGGESEREVSGTIRESYIAALSPEQGSRGQKITVEGRGFVPTDEEGGYGMFFRFDGEFSPQDGGESTRSFTGPDAIERVPDRVVSETTAEQAIWYEVEDRELTGLGATPGTFRGKIIPVLYDSEGSYRGMPWEGSFRVLPTKQVVYLKYLPSFSSALEEFGLRNVEREIRDRVLEVVRRDYAEYHVEIREDEPADFVDYATVELGGPDPTGTRSFGYDNSFNDVAKDTGNLFLADYLGGVNAATAEKFNNPYGGIFISTFTFFSRELNPDNPNASERFDEILRPFMPKLGGDPIRGTEWPNGPRVDAIARAIHMAGSAIGNTVTHEVGHSMGMTFIPGDFERPQNEFHNPSFRTGPYIMDSGRERPFEERAELDGAESPRFNETNREYLERILPKPE